MTRKFINFSAPVIEEDEISEVVDSLKSGWITTGPKVIQFEKAVCSYTGGKYAAATFSCTSALFLVLKALGIGPGDEVILPSFTFASTAHVVVHCGARPVFVDINSTTMQMDTSQISSLINESTKVIMPVHYGGNTVEMNDIFKLAKRHNIKVVEDAAHAIGSSYQGQHIGSLDSMATCLSFYATKNITTAEGGMVLSWNEELVRMVKKLTMYGISDAREIWADRYTQKGNWFYDIEMIGYKANMTDLCAALGLHQLRKLNKFIAIRKKYADIYLRELQNLGCDFMRVMPGNSCSWQAFPLLLPTHIDRDNFIVRLRERSIGASVLFRPLHLHSAYQKLLGTKEGDFPACEGVFNRLVNIPISPAISEDDVQYVVKTIKELLG